MNVLARSSNESKPDRIIDPQEKGPAASEQSPTPSPSRTGLSIISEALAIVGQLESAGDIRIDGKIHGDIRGHMVTIADGATIKGTVSGEGVELAGTIEGKIEARNVVLTKTARMHGDIIHESLKIDRGACFSGVSRPHGQKNRG